MSQILHKYIFQFIIYGTQLISQIWDKFPFLIYGTPLMTQIWDKLPLPIYGTPIMTRIRDKFIMQIIDIYTDGLDSENGGLQWSQWNYNVPNLSQKCNVTWDLFKIKFNGHWIE